MKVLVVDDNLLIRKIVRAALESEGFECDEAASGVEAIQTCRISPPEAVLLDLNLPDMDGLAVLRALKDQEQTKGIRAFLLSGSDEPDLPQRARDLGAEGCLSKPIRAADLSSRLRGS